MQAPRKVKYRKQFRGRRSGLESRGTKVDFGQFGLKALENNWLTARQIEAARRAMTRHIKRGGQIWIRVFPDRAVTATSVETPMGGGKGSVEKYVATARRGRIIFEMGGVSELVAREAMRKAAHKLPIKTSFVVGYSVQSESRGED